MSQDFTTTALLASVKRRGMLPSSDATFATADFLAVATEELQTSVMEILMSAREEYEVVSSDVSVAADSATYKLPERASAEALRKVELDDTTGTFLPLRRVEPERLADWGTTTAQPVGYILQDDSIILVPTPSAATTLRLYYPRRPSALVATSAVATIASINGARTVITTTATIPSTITSGILVDIVDNNPGFRALSVDLTTTATTSGTTITLTTALPASVSAGDYVCLAGESPVPMCPVELHKFLAIKTAHTCLVALGDPKAAVAEKAADVAKLQALRLITPRVVGASRYLVNKQAPGWRRRW